jgi:hypothetical protein
MLLGNETQPYRENMLSSTFPQGIYVRVPLHAKLSAFVTTSPNLPPQDQRLATSTCLGNTEQSPVCPVRGVLARTGESKT